MKAIDILTQFMEILPNLRDTIASEDNQSKLDTIRKLCIQMSHIDFLGIAGSAENQLCKIELAKPKCQKSTILYNSRNLAKIAIDGCVADDTKPIQYEPYPKWPLRTIRMIEDVPVPELIFPAADAYHLIPMPFYLLESKSGLYMRLTHNVICKVPFPNLYTADNREFKKKSVKCRFNDQDMCANYRRQMARINRTQIYPCTFAHCGEKFNRVGFGARCKVASFGNHESLSEDLARVQLEDIKHMLMNALNDLLLINMWLQVTCKKGVLILDSLDVC